MDIFAYAMQMEKDGEAYYRELADTANSKGLANILTFLADEEVKHYKIFKRMKEGKGEAPVSHLLDDVKNVFAELREKGETFHFDAKQPEHYRKAQEIEKRSEEFYREKAKEVGDPAQAEILNKIADEEKRHYNVLENIIDFVRQPERWLENAEWHHIGEE